MPRALDALAFFGLVIDEHDESMWPIIVASWGLDQFASSQDICRASISGPDSGCLGAWLPERRRHNDLRLQESDRKAKSVCRVGQGFEQILGSAIPPRQVADPTGTVRLTGVLGSRLQRWYSVPLTWSRARSISLEPWFVFRCPLSCR